MTSLAKLPRFTQTPAAEVLDAGGITTITLRPTVYCGVASACLHVALDQGVYDILTDHGFTNFGSLAGHLTVSRPDAPKKAARLHSLLLGVPTGYVSLYRDGDPLHLLTHNLGFQTPGGKTWWAAPREDEPDPAYTVEGLTYRYPAAITRRRGVVTGPPPGYRPLSPRSLEERLTGVRRRLGTLH